MILHRSTKDIYTFIILISLLVTAQAQFDNTIQSHVPATPTAASFAKYAEIPVSQYSGTASTSIPLHTLLENKMSHQVSISFHGAGIKASEIASSVGLGWTLNAGGVITRSVRGAPDERIYDGQLTGYWLDGVNTA